MICDTIHRRLLALERPELPPADLRQHLEVCAGCRLWHEHLVQIERDVPQLSLPAPVNKRAFLVELMQEAETPVSRPGVLRMSDFRSRPAKRERGLRKMAVAVALAATLLFLAFGVWIANQKDPVVVKPDQTVARKSPLEHRLENDARWDEARTPSERVKILDELANEVAWKALALPRGSPEDLQAQVRLYSEVVKRLADKEAPEMTIEDRSRLLRPIAGRLAEVQSEATRLAVTTPEARVALEELAYAAAEGDRKLRALIVI